MRGWIEFAIGACMVTAAHAQPLAVDAVNASEPTLCAETDNVYVKFISRMVRRFTIEAVHPVYLPTMSAENKEPDFSGCKMSPASDHKFVPGQVTLYDSGNWKLIGITYPNFWRAPAAPVRVGDRIETGLHLLQLWTRGRSRDEEVLVLYPGDGYWRARPLAPTLLGWQPDPLLPTAYGSSFLVGPVEQQGRPFVDLRDIEFDPASDTFRLAFVRGGSASLRIAALDESRISLDVAFEGAMTPQFAALRSMFVAPDNADAAVAWWTGSCVGQCDAGIMEFGEESVFEFRAGRARPSRHNTSAPDIVLKNFSGQAR
jgi:hypothetical protein